MNFSSPAPVVVLPVARFDHHLAVRWLRWTKTVTVIGRRTLNLVAICSPALDEACLEKLREAARNGPWDFTLHVSTEITELGYFGGTPSRCFLCGLEYVEKHFPGAPMLWAEADTVAMGADWFQRIADEFDACGKPFLGDRAGAPDAQHLTGVSVYGPTWRTAAPSLAALPGPDPRVAWDSSCSHETLPQSAPSKTIRQVWRPEPFTFENYQQVVPFGTALFHQDKTGTLIDVLAKAAGLPPIPSEPQICVSTYESDKAEMYRVLGSGAAGGTQAPRAGGGRVLRPEVLIVTFARDVGFLYYCLQALEKFAKGIPVTVAIPRHERKQFSDLPGKFRLHEFDEVPGKGMLSHEVAVCRADEICPNADCIIHIDADVIPWRPFMIADLAPGGKPRLLRERYDDCGRRNPNRLFWQQAVQNALGWKPEFETMVAFPHVHLREVYGVTRRLCESHTGLKFDEFMTAGRNEFPQQVCEFNMLGSVALKYYASAYTVVNYDHDKDGRDCGIAEGTSYQYVYRRERDFMAEFWSHGTVKPVEAWCRNFVEGRLPAYHVK